VLAVALFRLGVRHSDLSDLWWLRIPCKLDKPVFKELARPARAWQAGFQGGTELQRVLDRADGNRQRAEQNF